MTPEAERIIDGVLSFVRVHYPNQRTATAPEWKHFYDGLRMEIRTVYHQGGIDARREPERQIEGTP